MTRFESAKVFGKRCAKNMKFFSFFAVLLLAGSQPLHAVSSDVFSDHCPICKKKSHFTALMSFSMFGEPSRDFLDSPVFSFSGPRICPWDLYASQYNDWSIEDQNDVTQLRAKLKNNKPVIELTAAEGKFIEQIRRLGDEHPFLNLRAIWWVRTLRGSCSTAEEVQMNMALYRLCNGEKSPLPELREVYRYRLLELFQIGMTEKESSREQHLRYQYLHAEFLRKGGQLKEARKEFATFDALLSSIPEEDREKHEPLVTWTKEQLLMIEFKTVDLKVLMKNIRKPLPNPFRDDVEREQSWLKHRWALDELVARCVEGNRKASDALWDLLGRDAGKLLCLAETITLPHLYKFPAADARWEDWRQEMSARLENGKIPEGAKTKINQVRNVNILARIVKIRKKDYLRKAASEADTPEGRLRAALTIMEKGTREEAGKAAEKALGELRDLDLKMAEKEDMYSYPLQYISRKFGSSGDRFQTELEASLAKPWKEPFFREMARLWAGKPDALTNLEKTKALKVEPNYPGYGPAQMVYFYLEEKKDPAWKERCVRDLKRNLMLNRCVIRYAEVILTPDLAEVLLGHHAALMEQIQKEDKWDWRPGQAKDIEVLWKEAQLKKMPLRVVK